MPLLSSGEALHTLHRLQADRDHLANEAHDVLRVIGAVEVIDDAATLVGADRALIDDPQHSGSSA